MAHSHPPTGTAIISARGLTQSFRTADREQTVLNGLDVDIRRGDFTAIMGPSGAGKSTLLYALAGLERPTAGIIEFNGETITDMRDDALAVFRRAHCGFVFQQHQLLERMSLIDNVIVAGALNSHNSQAVLDVFCTLHANGQSIVMVTHDRHSALRANRVLYLRDGAIAVFLNEMEW